MVSANWCWWTYFLIDGQCASRGRIVQYDLATKSLTYLRLSKNDWGQNPYPLGTQEYQSWNWDTVTETFDEIWVDPARRTSLPREDFDLVEAGKRPPSFILLRDTDPKDYFAGHRETISTYLPGHPASRIPDPPESPPIV
jgi:hypothetical protein